MALDLNVALRDSDEVAASFVSMLSARDLQELEDAPALEPKEPLKRIRSQHHALARAIASGLTVNQAAVMVGYTPAHVSSLKSDPTFKELIAFYADKNREIFYDAAQRMAGLAEDAIAELSERILSGEKIPLETLMDIVKLAADRSGLGPQSKSTVNVNIGIASRLEEARRRMRVLNEIEGEVLPAPKGH